MAAKHITVAKRDGIEAGFTSLVEYLNTPLGNSNPKLAEIRESLEGLEWDDAVQVYAETFFGEPEATVEDKPRVVSFKRVTKATKRAETNTTPRKGRKTTKGTTRKAAPAGSCLTAGEVWIALGSDPDFEPNDHDKPANNGQLYRANTQGLITLA